MSCFWKALYDKILDMQEDIKIPARGWSALGGKNKKGGFLEIIVIIVIALLIMKYMGVTVSGVINWFTTFFRDVLK